MMKTITRFGWIWRFFAMLLLFFVCYIGGAMTINGKLPDIKPEPGLLSVTSGLMLVGIANTLLVIALIRSSRWSGLFLMAILSLSYFGAVTFVMQIETWYFLSNITVNPELMPYLFVMGLPVAFLFIPLSALILGKNRKHNQSFQSETFSIPFTQWIWKLSMIAGSYVILYWLAGYFIAWQNPELREFYGSPGTITPFRDHTSNTLRNDPFLFPFQVLRSMIWTLCALPIIIGSKLNSWKTAILVAVFFSIPQNLGHVMENALIPLASVRLSHFIETASSTFIFGLIVVWLLHRKHSSIKDLFR